MNGIRKTIIQFKSDKNGSQYQILSNEVITNLVVKMELSIITKMIKHTDEPSARP